VAWVESWGEKVPPDWVGLHKVGDGEEAAARMGVEEALRCSAEDLMGMGRFGETRGRMRRAVVLQSKKGPCTGM
jgi:hypothetical protein